jgi:protein disulfide-isomerase A5
MKEENIEGLIAAVDATKEKKIADKFKVKGFPTVKYYKYTIKYFFSITFN